VIHRRKVRSSGCRDYAETNFKPGRVFANERDFQAQLDAWLARVNARTHKTLRARPAERLAEELEVMAPLRAQQPDTDERWAMRVPPDPYVRVDICDYSLDPDLVGRRVEIRVTGRGGSCDRPGYRRGRRSPRPVVRPAPDDHRARARTRVETAARKRGAGANPKGLGRSTELTARRGRLNGESVKAFAKAYERRRMDSISRRLRSARSARLVAQRPHGAWGGCRFRRPRRRLIHDRPGLR
jgi:hypothetical protein